MKVLNSCVKILHTSALVLLLSSFSNAAHGQVVGIVATRVHTAEPQTNTVTVPAEFTVFRQDPHLEHPLYVGLNYSGTAGPQDFQPLPDLVHFPAGSNSVKIEVRGSPDNDSLEGFETVVANIVPRVNALDPTSPFRAYVVSSNNPSAQVVIHDATNGVTLPEVSISTFGRTEVNENGRTFPLFKLRRSIPRDSALTVYLSYSGTASSGQDYYALPPAVHFAPGHAETNIYVVPIDDDEVEETETVVAHLNPGPGYRLAKGDQVREVLIYDDDSGPVGSIELTQPEEGSTFRLGAPIPIVAVTVDQFGSIHPVEFFAGTNKIGATQSGYLKPPGFPVMNRIVWTNAPAGSHTLTARALDSRGNPISSDPVQIVVGNDSTNGTARIDITNPTTGSVFLEGQPIQIHALTFDPDGYVPMVEFYDGTNQIGTLSTDYIVAPSPGTYLGYSMVWSNVPPGDHVLTARGFSSSGKILVSPPVYISVGVDESRVTLAVEVVDALGTEPGPAAVVDDAIFQVRRVAGPTNEHVRMSLSFSGTAQMGTDYRFIDRVATLLPGQMATNLVVRALQDGSVEPNETVVLTLNPVICKPQGTEPPGFTCYQVFGTNKVQALIRDHSLHTNRPPSVAILMPHDGAVFPLGQPIDISAAASDPDGKLVRQELKIDGTLVWSTNGTHLAYRWSNPTLGEHQLLVWVVDNVGYTNQAVARILVRQTNDTSFVRRELPTAYSPGAPLRVRLLATPPSHAQAWGVEDQPPAGWTVSGISDHGVFDPVTGKVKFGHYTDATNRVMIYHVTPPVGTTGAAEFFGVASIDGRTEVVGGDRIIATAVSEYHPADLNRDYRMILSEVTAYAAAWKRGTNWITPPNPIPASYVTRAAQIWRRGEEYWFNPSTNPPLCWVPTAGIGEFAASTASEATRTISEAEDERLVTINVTPGAGVASYTLEEIVPEGWTVADISGEGAFSPENSAIRWGLFLDNEGRTLSYRLIPRNGTAPDGTLLGEMTIDGDVLTVRGDAQVVPVESTTPLSMATTLATSGDGVSLNLTGPSGQICVIEASTDLEHWTQIAEVFLPNGRLNFSELDTEENSQRYYRLRSE